MGYIKHKIGGMLNITWRNPELSFSKTKQKLKHAQSFSSYHLGLTWVLQEADGGVQS